MRGEIAATGLALALALPTLPIAADAQEPTGPWRLLQPFAAIPPPAPPGSSQLFPLAGEPTGDSGSLPGYMASAPIRLSLQSQIRPIGGGYSECASREDSAGNSIGGIPIQRYSLLRLTPHLELHGFTSAGCPIDGAIGAALTYTVQVKPTLWLVAGAGVYTAPAPAQLAARRTRSDFHIDLVKKVNTTQSLSVGIGRRGVTFGGAF